MPLTIVQSPYRGLIEPVVDYLAKIDIGPRDVVEVFVPEYVVGHWWEQMLHNQSALRLKTRLLYMPGVMVTSVPYHLSRPSGTRSSARAPPPSPELRPAAPRCDRPARSVSSRDGEPRPRMVRWSGKLGRVGQQISSASVSGLASRLSRRRQGYGFAVACLAPFLITGVLVPLREVLGLDTVLLVFVLVSVVASVLGGVLPALVASAVSFGLANFFFTSLTAVCSSPAVRS